VGAPHGLLLGGVQRVLLLRRRVASTARAAPPAAGAGPRPRRRRPSRAAASTSRSRRAGFGEAPEPDAARRTNGAVEREPPVNAGRNANGALADAEARKKAEEAEAKRKAEEAEAKRKKEERDAELAAYYQEQWANEEDGPPEAAAAETAPLNNEPSGLQCGVTENPGWGEFVAPYSIRMF
jgi:solute carrier family 23 (nucleobase transporter), member 1